jgi:hypothetical protein
MKSHSNHIHSKSFTSMRVPIFRIVAHAHFRGTRGVRRIKPDLALLKWRTVKVQRDGGVFGTWVLDFVVTHVIVDVGD